MMLTITCALVAVTLSQPKPTPDAPVDVVREGVKESHQTQALDKALGWVWLTGTSEQALWHGYKQQTFPAGWTMMKAALASKAGGSGGDIMTREQYGDFELMFDFNCDVKANSGVIYRATEKHDASWMTGPEYQVIDDAGNNLQPGDPHSAGALYDIVKPPSDKVFKAGDWNSGRIYVRNGLIQHWLNGKKVAEVEAFDSAGKPTEAWKKAIAASKFKDYEGFGVQPKGSIVLQDHGDKVTYRDIKVRALDTKAAGQVDLFNGKDLTGWTAVVPDLAAKKEDQTKPWSVKDGVLRCEGQPIGYIRTNEKYKDFIFRCQWRFDPSRGAGNSGVLLRMIGEDKVWPKSIEAQLESGNAGDFWNIDNVKMTVPADRTKGRNTKHTHGAERPLGAWNEYEIVCVRGMVQLYVNGELLNEASGCEDVAGYICLQSEGAYIEFRDIRLVPVP